MSKSILIKATIASALPIAIAGNAFAFTTEQFTPEANKASYWGTSCVKYDSVKSETYTAPAGATKVIIKGGTMNAIYVSGPFTNLTAATNPSSGKPYGISHVIVCMDKTTATPETPNTPEVDTPETPDKETPVTPEKPVTPVVDGDKEDKNQSACNPSDTNSANPKHHDDGKDCEDDKEDSVDNGDGQGGGQVSGEAVSTTKTPEVKGANTTVPSELPKTGAALSGLFTALGIGASAYGISLRRK